MNAIVMSVCMCEYLSKRFYDAEEQQLTPKEYKVAQHTLTQKKKKKNNRSFYLCRVLGAVYAQVFYPNHNTQKVLTSSIFDIRSFPMSSHNVGCMYCIL